MTSPTGPLGFTDGQLETLKWIALASMFLDHFGRHLMGHGQETWVFAGGRIAFPLFAAVLGLNLAREGDRAARTARTAMRLAAWCAVAVLPSIWARGEPWLVNILGTLGLGAALCWSLVSTGHLALRIAVVVLAAAVSWHVEFGPAGVFLVPAVFLCGLRRQPEGVVLTAALLAAVAWHNGTFGGVAALAATLSCTLIVAAARHLPLRAPRLSLAFYAVYPLHLLLIGALKALR